MSLSDGSKRVLWSATVPGFDLNSPGDYLVVDGEDVFFLGGEGIQHILTCGSLYPNVVIEPGKVNKIAVDAGYVYWSDGASISRSRR